MLDKTAYTTLSVMPQTCGTISGQTISKTKKWDARYRARLAAEWKLGVIEVEPTVKQAAETFRVSVPYVMEAITDLEADAQYVAAGRLISNGNGSATPVSGIDVAWMEMDEFERNAFVLRHLNSIWDAVEAVT